MRELPALAIMSEDQCCQGCCIDGIGVHDVTRDEAEWIRTAVLDLVEDEVAADRRRRESARAGSPAHPNTMIGRQAYS